MALELMKSRWLALVVSCWIQVLNSPIYLFSTYSQAMKLSLQLDQATVTKVSAFISFGSALGIIPGYGYRLLPPWTLVLLGASFQSIALLLTWLTMVHRLQGGAWHLCLYQMLIGISFASVQTAVLTTNMSNFPLRGGAVAGLLKGYVVLGASVLLQLFYLVSGPEHLIDLPRMLSFLVALTLAGMFSVRSLPVTALGAYKRQLPNLFIMSTCLLALSLCLMVSSTLEISVDTFPHSAHVLVALIVLVLLFSLTGPGVKAELLTSSNFTLTRFDVVEAELLVETSSDFKTADRSEGYTLRRTLSSVSFWILFLALTCGFGSVNALQNNLAQLANSLGHTQKTASICVSLFCICSCWGRIGVGLASDYCMGRFQTPRTVFLGLAMVVNSISMVVAAVPVSGGLIISTVMSGMVEGALWCLYLATASDVFGSGSLNMVYNVLLPANSIGTYVIASRVVGYLYDKAAGPGSLLCHGDHCFRIGFFVASGVSLAGACICALLTVRLSSTKVAL